MANSQVTQTAPVAYKTYIENGVIRSRPIYYDQFYKLPFLANVRMKLKR